MLLEFSFSDCQIDKSQFIPSVGQAQKGRGGGEATGELRETGSK